MCDDITNDERYRQFPKESHDFPATTADRALSIALSWHLPDLFETNSFPHARSVITGSRGIGYVFVLYSTAVAPTTTIHAFAKSPSKKRLRAHRDAALHQLNLIRHMQGRQQ